MSPLRRRVPAQRTGELAHPLLVGTTDHDRSDAVFHDILECDHLADQFGPAGFDHVEALVEGDLGAEIEQLEIDVRMQLHLHLATAREHVDRGVVVLAHDHAVGIRWLGQLVDFVAQRGDVLARLAQRVAELLVLCGRLGQLTLRLEQPFLQRSNPIRGVCEARPQVGVLLTQDGELSLDRGQIAARRVGRIGRAESIVPICLVHEHLPRSFCGCPELTP